MADTPAPTPLGTADLKILLALLIEIGNVADAVGRDTTIARWGKLFNLIDEVAALGSIHLDQVVPEFKDLDEAEQADLKAFLKEKLQLADVNLEAAIEKGLDIVTDAVKLVENSISLVKSFKA